MGKTARRQNGDGSLYVNSDGMWVAALSLPSATGKRRRWTAKAKTQEAALDKLRKKRAELDRTGDVITASPTLDEWLTRWLETIVRPNRKPRTYAEYELTARLHLSPTIGKVRLAKLNQQHVRKAVAEPLAAGKLATVQKIRGVLSIALADAEREDLVGRNVARLTVLPSPMSKDQAVLSTAQARTLVISAVGTPSASRWLMALLTGQRQGECLGLTWDRLDLVNGIADISWQLQRLTRTSAAHESRHLEGSFYLTRPKTGGSRRLIPLDPTLVRALIDHYDRTIDEPNPHNLVWNHGGKPIDAKADREAWSAGLAAKELPAVKLHAARHTTATLLMEMGHDVKTIGQLLGHNAVLTTRGYQTANMDLVRLAVTDLGRALT